MNSKTYVDQLYENLKDILEKEHEKYLKCSLGLEDPKIDKELVDGYNLGLEFCLQNLPIETTKIRNKVAIYNKKMQKKNERIRRESKIIKLIKKYPAAFEEIRLSKNWEDFKNPTSNYKSKAITLEEYELIKEWIK